MSRAPYRDHRDHDYYADPSQAQSQNWAPPYSQPQASYSQPQLHTRQHPGVHPQSSYSRLRENRYSGGDYYSDHPDRSYAPPAPPVQAYNRQQPYSGRDRDLGHSQPIRSASTTRPGPDNFGRGAVGGGIAGAATGVASSDARRAGPTGFTGYQYEPAEGLYRGPADNHTPYHNSTTDNPYVSPVMAHPDDSRFNSHDPYSSNAPVSPMDGNQYHAPSNGYTRDRGQEGLMPQGGYHQHPGGRGAGGGGGGGLYDDGPYSRPRSLVMQEPINPNEIVDDGDDGFGANPQRRSLLSVVQNSSRSNLAAAGAATSATVLTSDAGGGGGGPGATAGVREKSEWLEEERHRKKRLKWIIVICVIIVLCLAGAGAALGVILPNRNNGQSAGSGGQGGDDLPGPEIQNAADDTRVNGDLDINSGEIKALMDDPDLHRIFPGIDYTPWGTQYPLCMKFPPSQNNITRDMAVLSQLSNVVRLYGTDCNQTEMVLHAIDKLQLTDMKLWMGVWIDTNTTTNERQLEQMYKVLDSTEDLSVFKGVIIGNEFLYRGFQTFETLSTLSDYISSVRGNFSERGIDLPIATSDLGDAWTSSLVELVDVVMANVHPFFGGIPIEQGAGWTYTFWSQHNAPLTEGTSKENIIAEVGWPTGGGNNCSPLEQCPDDTTGAVSGVDELNKFMEDWVCQALDNGTNYFWFEAFDEPWKIQYNTPGKEWEDKWGLMTPDRKLKPRVKIPDCGGRTAR